MMYFREDSKRPLSVSREQFEENWDRIFNKKPEYHPIVLRFLESERCHKCKNDCYSVINKDLQAIVLKNPTARVSYYGYCKSKKVFVFTLTALSKFVDSGDDVSSTFKFSISGTSFIALAQIEDDHCVVVNMCHELIPSKDLRYIRV